MPEDTQEGLNINEANVVREGGKTIGQQGNASSGDVLGFGPDGELTVQAGDGGSQPAAPLELRGSPNDSRILTLATDNEASDETTLLSLLTKNAELGDPDIDRQVFIVRSGGDGDYYFHEQDGNTDMLYFHAPQAYGSGAVVFGINKFGIFAREWNGNFVFAAGEGGVYMSNLPTSDPQSADQLWNDAGTLKISAGP